MIIMVSIMTVGYKKKPVRGDETRTNSLSNRRYTDSKEIDEICPLATLFPHSHAPNFS